MEYRDAMICRIMLLSGVDADAAARRIDDYTAGRIGRRDLYAPPCLEPQPGKARQGRPAGGAKKRAKRRPRVDLPEPRPFRSSGRPRINMEALGRAGAECLRSGRWQDMMYEYDLLMATTLRMDHFVLHGDVPQDFD